MSTTKPDFIENDRSQVEVKFVDTTRSVIDLTTVSTINFNFRINGGGLTSGSMTKSDATNGLATYRFGSGELTPGIMSAQAEFTDTSGFNFTTSPAWILIVGREV